MSECLCVSICMSVCLCVCLSACLCVCVCDCFKFSYFSDGGMFKGEPWQQRCVVFLLLMLLLIFCYVGYCDVDHLSDHDEVVIQCVCYFLRIFVRLLLVC